MTAVREKVWLITGAGRGMGADFARAALAGGDAVVAAARNTTGVADALGDHENLLVVKLDVTSRAEGEAAVAAAVERFQRIDVLVNNAGISVKGFFEETTPEAVEQQLATNLLGPMNVTRAVLPVMRKQRSGHIVSISSGAGLSGFAFSSLYAASKFGLEGWMDALAKELQPFDIKTTVVNPGFFRTELLTERSAFYAEAAVDDYAEARAKQMTWWAAQNGRQLGDPAKLAGALIALAHNDAPPRRLIAGSDVVELAEKKIAELQQQIDADRDLAASLAFNDNSEGERRN